jgi:hypothetical protein
MVMLHLKLKILKMIITYNKTYREASTGNGWKLYSCVSLKDSVIINILYNIVLKNTTASFDEIYTSLKENYKHKIAKSRCGITKDNGIIEVTVKGVFPKFYIEKEPNASPDLNGKL